LKNGLREALKMSKQNSSSDSDIYQLLLETYDKRKKERRAQLLKPFDVKEYFEEGGISIDKKTCKGVECKLCLEVCPTNALYWKSGEVGIVEDLCIYCAACVLSCIVDDCIKIWRKRFTGEVERFSKPRDVVILQHNTKTKKRLERACEQQKTSRALRRRMNRVYGTHKRK